MQIFETKQKVVDGKLIIDIPDGFEGKELTVVITETVSNIDLNDWASLPGNERIKILKQFAGSAKYPDTDTSDWDVYDQ